MHACIRHGKRTCRANWWIWRRLGRTRSNGPSRGPSRRRAPTPSRESRSPASAPPRQLVFGPKNAMFQRDFWGFARSAERSAARRESCPKTASRRPWVPRFGMRSFLLILPVPVKQYGNASLESLDSTGFLSKSACKFDQKRPDSLYRFPLVSRSLRPRFRSQTCLVFDSS